MGMFPRFIQSLVATSGCCAISLVVLCTFGSTAHALAEEDLMLPSVSSPSATSSVSESILAQNNHPPVDAGQPGGGTTGAGTR